MRCRGNIMPDIFASFTPHWFLFDTRRYLTVFQSNNRQLASGEGSVICNSAIDHVCVARPYHISGNSIFQHLPLTQSVDNAFCVFIVLSENEYFLTFNLQCYFTNVTSCSLLSLRLNVTSLTLLPALCFHFDLMLLH